MAKVRLLHGKPLMVGGKVALSDDCCCGQTPTDCSAITSITFSGVEFCCACSDESAQRIQFVEDGDFGLLNDIPFTLPRTGSFGVCQSVCYNNGSDPPPDQGIFLGLRVSLLDGVCPTGLETIDGPFSLTVFVSLIAGLWNVLLVVEGAWIFFYGASADPTSIPNLITDCTLSPATWDSDLIECIDAGPIVECAVAKNGTASLAF